VCLVCYTHENVAIFGGDIIERVIALNIGLFGFLVFWDLLQKGIDYGLEVFAVSFAHENVGSLGDTTEDGYVFVCVADKAHKTNSCFLFLKDLQKNFNPDSASKFKGHLKKAMVAHSNDSDKISAINAELEDVKNIMQENIEKVVKRGDNLEALDATTSQLEQDASGFRQRAVKLKNAVWWGSMRMKIIIGVAILVIIGIIILAICLSPSNICKPSQ